MGLGFVPDALRWGALRAPSPVVREGTGELLGPGAQSVLVVTLLSSDPGTVACHRRCPWYVCRFQPSRLQRDHSSLVPRVSLRYVGHPELTSPV